MMMPRTLKRAVLFSALTLGSASLHAATQGTLGATSEGTSDISITKGDAVMITKINDINFGSWDATQGDVTQSDQVCVHSTTGNYKITATSTQGADEFQMKTADGTSSVNYSVIWLDTSTTGATDIALTHATAAGSASAGSLDQDCGGQDSTNARFTISLTSEDLGAAAAGDYSDTLKLLVSPE